MDIGGKKSGERIGLKCRRCRPSVLPSPVLIYIGRGRAKCPGCETEYLVTRRGKLSVLKSGPGLERGSS